MTSVYGRPEKICCMVVKIFRRIRRIKNALTIPAATVIDLGVAI